jgi:hypothetical protein
VRCAHIRFTQIAFLCSWVAHYIARHYPCHYLRKGFFYCHPDNCPCLYLGRGLLDYFTTLTPLRPNTGQRRLELPLAGWSWLCWRPYFSHVEGGSEAKELGTMHGGRPPTTQNFFVVPLAPASFVEEELLSVLAGYTASLESRDQYPAGTPTLPERSRANGTLPYSLLV